jgi:hypothetical protein
VHLLGVAFYTAGTVVLFRTVRPAFGRYASGAGLILLLGLPSLFAWSISALKEPLFFLLGAAALALGAAIAKSSRWRIRTTAVAAAVAVAVALDTIRAAGAALTATAVVGGLAVGAVARRPRLLLAALILTPILAGALLRLPAVQHRAYGAVQMAARQHWGHVATPGHVYKLLDDRLYPDRSTIDDIRFGESMRFLTRAIVRYATAPAPWEVQSRAALAYLPEQMIWYVLLALAPFGLFYGMRRDSVVAGLLFAHAAVFAVSVALVSGNVGTLVRHRGLALPFLVWLSSVGGCELLSRCVRAGRERGAAPVAAPAPNTP